MCIKSITSQYFFPLSPFPLSNGICKVKTNCRILSQKSALSGELRQGKIIIREIENQMSLVHFNIQHQSVFGVRCIT